jgi:hypothetical protein
MNSHSYTKNYTANNLNNKIIKIVNTDNLNRTREKQNQTAANNTVKSAG